MQIIKHVTTPSLPPRQVQILLYLTKPLNLKPNHPKTNPDINCLYFIIFKFKNKLNVTFQPTYFDFESSNLWFEAFLNIYNSLRNLRRCDITGIDQIKSIGVILDTTIKFEISNKQPEEVNKEKTKIDNPTILYY